MRVDRKSVREEWDEKRWHQRERRERLKDTVSTKNEKLAAVNGTKKKQTHWNCYKYVSFSISSHTVCTIVDTLVFGTENGKNTRIQFH